MSEQAPSTPDIVQYPLLPLRDVVVFPHMVIPLFVGRPKSIKAMETAMEAGKSILLVAQKSAAKDDPSAQDMYSIGCVSNILQMLKLPDGTVKVLVEGGTRAEIREITDVRTHWIAEAVPVPLDDALLHLLEAVVVLIQDVLGRADVLRDLRLLLPRQVDDGLDVVANDRRLGGHRRHELQLLQLRLRFLARFLVHVRAADLLLHLLEVRALLAFAELLLDRLHLLVQVVLALALLHLPLHAPADALLDLEDVDFRLELREQVLEAGLDVEHLEHLLLLLELERQVRRHGIGKPAGFVDAGKRSQDL